MICRSLAECFTIDLRQYDRTLTLGQCFRLFFNEGWAMAVTLLRLSQYLSKKRFFWRFALLTKRTNEIFTGVECHLKATIQKGLFIPHPQNIVIGEGCFIGKNVSIYNGVTLGANRRGNADSTNRYPIVEDNVIIYSGAKILGPILLGEGSVIGANAVVLQNVPAYHLAVGVPAKIIPIRPESTNPPQLRGDVDRSF